MSAENKDLVAYIPVIHKGYLELFNRLGGEVDELWVLGQGLINQLSIFPREIRAVNPEIIAKMAESLGVFDKVEILDKEKLPRLENKHIVLPSEEISRQLVHRYFKLNKITFENVFLRWEESDVATPMIVVPDRVSNDPFDRQIMNLARGEAEMSSDWWRHTGAVVVKDRQVLAKAHNRHVPAEQTQYVDGDPRDVIQAGTHSELYSSIHAEQLIIAEAAGGKTDFSGAEIYINVFPCPTCTKLIAFSGINKCFYQTGSAWMNSDEVMRAFKIEIVRVED